MEFYIKNTVPLEMAEELIEGEDYFNEDGHCFKYLGNGEFNFVKQSPLQIGEKLTNLNKPEVLRLFWILSKRMG